jgi:UDP-glucose 4-epimerase
MLRDMKPTSRGGRRMPGPLEQKHVLITGGTGSLGRALVRRLLMGEAGIPKRIVVFSRDETKQHYMRLRYAQRVATDEIIYQGARERLRFRIGDVRNYASVAAAVRDADVVFNAAALKQVPTCEYFPEEAVATNVQGPENIVRAIRENDLPVETVVGISTDKACKPINVMGMTKALQERIFLGANLGQDRTRYICVRYGNVISSRGSVVPLFLDQIKNGGPLTITMREMTRFLLTLEQAVDTILAAVQKALPGETYVPKVPSARMVDLAKVLIGRRDVKIKYTGIRPGEKVHEILVSEEERYRTIEREGYYVIEPILPEARHAEVRKPALDGEYSSAGVLLAPEQLRELVEPLVEAGATEEDLI